LDRNHNRKDQKTTKKQTTPKGDPHRLELLKEAKQRFRQKKPEEVEEQKSNPAELDFNNPDKRFSSTE
jgi:hypothetical protein